MKSRSKWLLVVTACVAITVVLAGIKTLQIRAAIAKGKAFGEPKEVVELAHVTQLQWQPTITVTAEVKALQSVELSNEFGGRVVEIGFAAGELVKEGQLLVRLDTTEEQAQLAAAKADAELAALALARNQKLAKSGVASEEARDQALAQRNAAVASEDRLRAIIDKKTLRAPFTGMAGIFELEVGQFLQANTVITKLIGNSDQVWLDFNLPQQQATLVVGDTVTVTNIKSRNSQSSADFTATIIAKDSWVNPRSGNLRYRAIADNTQGRIYPGTVVSLAVNVGEPRQVMRVPMTSIRYDALGPNVYVLEAAEPGAKAPDRAQKRPVVLGPEQDQQVVILSGLNIGERIAGNGAFKLRNGLLVTAVDKQAQPASGEAVSENQEQIQ
ncbi:efflux RND transporter periplasmic adaptor subunit [Oceanicoccus sp. KOV_DT_Chl]|uniref:efflux RND transporter periplasmic adaptor subunit n=1 Tax=Oceanicoccus sp. KOV_DT_Chl TaxID=1904639 RepID=UPI001356B454|nr:efflux RND transporter periplasmic adaptor subunit [Oceanicoccus sp. KOV_DT_Chl]